jgi:Fe2+ or Zn2+ uptake regulation protein
VTENDNQSRSEQREAILRYLAACPNAADTAEGVLNWWFPRQRYNDTRDAIERALEELAAEGRLARLQLPDGRVIYACAQEGARSDR